MTLLGSQHLPKIEEGTKTVTTAGTPVQLTALKGKKAYIQSVVENGDKLIVIGDSTVDGQTTPPTGRCVLFASQSEKFEENDTSKIYVDSNQDGAVFRYVIYG